MPLESGERVMALGVPNNPTGTVVRTTTHPSGGGAYPISLVSWDDTSLGKGWVEVGQLLLLPDLAGAES